MVTAATHVVRVLDVDGASAIAAIAALAVIAAIAVIATACAARRRSVPSRCQIDGAFATGCVREWIHTGV